MKIDTNKISKDLIVTNWQTSLNSAYEEMKKSKVRHLLVLDDSGYLVGVISDRDFQRAIKVDDKFLFDENAQAGFDSKLMVRDYMSWPVLTVDRSTSWEKIIEIMMKQKISAVVVTDEAKGVVGIITTDDMLKMLFDILNNPINKKIETVMKRFKLDKPMKNIFLGARL